MGRILRIIIVTILVVFALRALRMIWSALTGGEKVKAQGGRGAGPARAQADAVPTSGVLRKCAHCGVYVSEALALKQAGGAEPVFFCSAECQRQGRA
jgi:hypothetical protein